MEKEIILPEPIHINKIHRKMDMLSEINVIRQWVGYEIIDTFFYLYLFNKYKQKCVIKNTGLTSNETLGIELQIKDNMPFNKMTQYFEYLNTISEQIIECIKNNVDNIIIPLYLKFTNNTGHANVLIYRKKNNTIEHFEPNSSISNAIIDKKVSEFINILNDNLNENNLPTISLVKSNVVCPYEGLQTLEVTYSSIEYKDIEGNGYCAAWSMFFTELVLKNPNLSSNELINIIFSKLDEDKIKRSNYLRKVITGYVNIIYEKIEKYFYFVSGINVSFNEAIQILETNGFDDFYTIIDIQKELYKHPQLTKEKYIEYLEYKIFETDDENEIKLLNKRIQLFNNMGKLLSPNSVSSKSRSRSKSKSKSRSKTKTRSISKSRSSSSSKKSKSSTRKSKSI
jgi:hypothetical protein